jgi:DNA polymerase III epsilon subunit-like protein
MPDCIFVDTETTGLDDVDNDIIDIWAERRDFDTLALKKAAGGRVIVLAKQIARMDERPSPTRPTAREVNHFSEAAWANAKPWFDRCAEVSKLFVPGETILWIGSNPWFDIDMVRAMHWKYGTRMPNVRRIVRDTADMAAPLKKAKVVTSCSLSVLAEHFGLPAQSHTAKGDVTTCVEVYRRLREKRT